MLRAFWPMKDDIAFHIAVHQVRERDPRYAPQAYAFLCDALQHTMKILGREDAEDRHVKGGEILAGFRDLAMHEFGPMAFFVMQEWGIRESLDVGNMVYNFISLGYFGKNETDRIEDFNDGVSFEAALTKPYRRV